MEIKVKPKAIESTIISTKGEDDMKMMKERVVISQETEEENSTKEQESVKVMDDETQTREDDPKSESRSSSSSSSLEMMKKLENDSNSSEKAENTKKEEEKKNMKNKKTSSHVWDCGSSLYDSFELNSFKRQLDSAISASSARSMSMSHLPDRRLPADPLISSVSAAPDKKHSSNKISRSLQRFLKSVFRSKHHQSVSKDGCYDVVYEKSGSLTTIPESTEKEVGPGPEINSLVRKTVSERFPASRVVGISCA